MTAIERSLHYTHTTVVHLQLQQLSGREFRCVWPCLHADNYRSWQLMQVIFSATVYYIQRLQ